MFGDSGLVKMNMRHNSTSERKRVLEAEFILKEKTNWVDGYKELILYGWSWEKAAYIAWASAPKKLRKPKYLYQFAELIGVHRKSIAQWIKNDFAMNMVIRERILTPLIEHQRDVLDALVESATNPDPKNYSDRKMFLEITELYVPGKALLGKVRSNEPGYIANRTDEELERIISIELNKIRKQEVESDERENNPTE